MFKGLRPYTVSRLYNETDLTGFYIVFLSFAQNTDSGCVLEPSTISVLSEMLELFYLKQVVFTAAKIAANSNGMST